MKQDDSLLATVSRALTLLELFEDSRTGLTLTEIARNIDLPKSSTYRYLTTLEQRGYLERDAETDRYQLGLKILQLGTIAGRRLDFNRIALPVMWQLREQFTETVNLGVPRGHEVMYLEVLESVHTVKIAAQVGERSPMHATALGKAILASMSADQAKELIGPTLREYTEYTITNWPDLLQEFEQIRDLGFAVDAQESYPQVHCVGAVVRNHTGSVIGGISISGAISRLSIARVHEIGPDVLAGAEQISARLGYRQEAQEPA